MNLLKKLFGRKGSAESQSDIILITLNDKIKPIDRAAYYEDPLNEFLHLNNIGEVTGGGTMQEVSGEIEFVDIEVQVNKGVDRKIAAMQILGYFKANAIPVPKNSTIMIERTDETILFGDKEGLAIYLDGQHLDEEVYNTCDSNFVVSEIKRLIGDTTSVVRFWEFPEKTGLYFYGDSFKLMRSQIDSFINEYPLCKNAEVKQIA